MNLLKPNQYLKFTRRGRVGPYSRVKLDPYKWLPPIKPELCHYGYHVCRPGHLAEWVDDDLWIVDARGESDEGDNKIAFESIRLARRHPGWDWRQAQLFAAWCSEQVLCHYEDAYPRDTRMRDAIAARRAWANGEISKKEWDDARAAAYSAAYSVTWSPAYSAAWSTLESAAWSVAYSAARDAAYSAAWSTTYSAAYSAAWSTLESAAWDAAYSAARRTQNAELHRILGLEYTEVTE